MSLRTIFRNVPSITVVGCFFLGLIFWAIGDEGGKCLTFQNIQPICSGISVKIVFWILSGILALIAILKLYFSYLDQKNDNS